MMWRAAKKLMSACCHHINMLNGSGRATLYTCIRELTYVFVWMYHSRKNLGKELSGDFKKSSIHIMWVRNKKSLLPFSLHLPPQGNHTKILSSRWWFPQLYPYQDLSAGLVHPASCWMSTRECPQRLKVTMYKPARANFSQNRRSSFQAVMSSLAQLLKSSRTPVSQAPRTSVTKAYRF